MKYCSVPWCGRTVINSDLCIRHRTQVYLHGYTYRNTYDPNEYTVINGVCEVALTDRKLNILAITLVDLMDIEKVLKYRWYLGPSGYAQNKNKRIRLHRYIMGLADDSLVIDHINHDKLDNRKSNLRICTHSENHAARRIQSNNTSGYKGVTYDKARSKYEVQIKFNGKKYFVGRFRNIIDAALAYNEKALELHGDFAVLNNIPEEDKRKRHDIEG